ncbi:MAG TPA: chemotaxis protein CheX [Pseudobdellovibrionaceae bacterium]|nr:chemotaxis protein CheX [Pseudobdellovibrionaceae bacterium]
MDIEFIKPFLEGVVQVMKVQFACAVKPLPPYPKQKAVSPAPIDIAAIIGVRGEKFNGSVALGLPAGVFLKLMSNMLGENYSEITDEVEDGAGEMLNMIFGHAKIALNQKGHSLEKAIPTVVRGQNLSLKALPSKNTLVLPFQTDFGTFFLEIGTDENNVPGESRS